MIQLYDRWAGKKNVQSLIICASLKKAWICSKTFFSTINDLWIYRENIQKKWTETSDCHKNLKKNFSFFKISFLKFANDLQNSQKVENTNLSFFWRGRQAKFPNDKKLWIFLNFFMNVPKYQSLYVMILLTYFFEISSFI